MDNVNSICQHIQEILSTTKLNKWNEMVNCITIEDTYRVKPPKSYYMVYTFKVLFLFLIS